MERLTFKLRGAPAPQLSVVARHAAPPPRERYDVDYLCLLAFTAVLFFRPQDQVPALQSLHLAELTAIAGLIAMIARRVRIGALAIRWTPEVAGVAVLGAVMAATIPFSIWPGGSTHVLVDIFAKIVLIFALMATTLTSAARISQLMWLMISASAYIAARAVFDYVRGINLVEGDRVRGAVGGMFQNPNDLALNLVTFLGPTLFIIMEDRRLSRRVIACGLAAVMLAAIVCTKSRSGFLGLVMMGAVVAYFVIRRRPGFLLAGVLAAVLAAPLLPDSFWHRMVSIVDAEEDITGSREARLRLLTQAVEVFAENPVTGIGAGQFQNYDDPAIVTERWRVTHNVWLQVAAELGIFGLLAFAYLVYRAYATALTSLKWLRPRRRDRLPALSARERDLLSLNARAMLAALVGWTVCSLFASVAFNWTFYYILALAASGHQLLRQRRTAIAAPAAARERFPRRLAEA